MQLKITYLKATVLLILLLVVNFFISKLDSYLHIIICTCLVNLLASFACVNLFKSFTISAKNDIKSIMFSLIGALGFVMINISMVDIFQLLFYKKINLSGDSSVSYSFIVVLARILLFPIVEEIFFRRVLTEGIYNQYGFKPALLVSAFGFSIMHIFSDSGLLIVFLGGLFLGYVYIKTRNLFLTIGLHVIINSTLFFLSNSIVDLLNSKSMMFSLILLIFFLILGVYILTLLKKINFNTVK